MIELLNFIVHNHLFRDFVDETARRLQEIDWDTMWKVSSVLVVTLLLVCLLVLINDRMFEKSMNRRMKVHHLTIRNDGNSASVYLLHTVDLPKTLAIRFRIDGNPMIWVSFDSGKNQETEQQEAVQTTAVSASDKSDKKDGKQKSGSELVPNLNDPLKPVGEVTKAASDVGKKAGFLASIISTISVLVPSLPSGLKDAQNSLKGIQQDSNTLVGDINTKSNAVNTLGDQLGKLPGADKVSGAVQSSGIDPESAVMNDPQRASGSDRVMSDASNTDDGNLILGSNFVYDEDIWRMNIGKKDDSGGALNYAQSKVLQPGESMKIDLEIMNLSESTAPYSQMYKIEVIQVPQTRLHLSSVSRFLNGIVMFDKVPEISRIFPSVIAFLLVIAAVQVIAWFTYLIF